MPPGLEPLDFQRMFFGDEFSLLFLLEVLIRTCVMYIFALLVVRLVGKRGMGQLSPFDYVIIIALGSAVGDPMFYPDVPLVHGMVVLTMVVLLERGLALATERNRSLEEFVEGRPSRVALNGRLDMESLNREDVSSEEVFTLLRQESVEHLGQVERAYLERSGRISVFRYPERDVKPGLPLIPPWDLEGQEAVESGTRVEQAGAFACRNCGEVIRLMAGEAPVACPVCQGTEWALALLHPVEAQGLDD
ncbi:MAG: YetF domain-containing protein [Candidatus Promineifilaceae bacterium]